MPTFDFIQVQDPTTGVLRRVLRVNGPYGPKDQGRHVWCARIADLDGSGRYGRQFLGERKAIGRARGTLAAEMHVFVDLMPDRDVRGCLSPGDLLELSSRKHDRQWYRFDRPDDIGSRLTELDIAAFSNLLGKKIAEGLQFLRDPMPIDMRRPGKAGSTTSFADSAEFPRKFRIHEEE